MTIQRFLPYVLAISAGLAALFFPLLRDFHIESAVPAALFGAFFAAIVASNRKQREKDLRQLVYVMSVVYTAALPILISVLIRGCFTSDGLGYWVFYPALSIYFGYAVGRFFRVSGFQFPTMYSMFVLLFISVGGLIAELFLLPQVYFHNHVWGGWPGAIYDLEIAFTGSELFYRSITFSWATLLWLAPAFRQNSYAKFGVLLFTLSLMLSYSQLSRAGIISPGAYIQAELGGYHETPHFHIYYSKRHYTESEIKRTAAWHEFHLQEIAEILDVELPPQGRKIESYLYGHPWQMDRLVGAKNVSYVPVWSITDQLHISKNAIDRTLRHELVHVAAKQFGNRIMKASWSIGLLEGLAVALSPGSRSVTTIDQAVASTKEMPEAHEIRKLMSPAGFYAGRGPASYTLSGSFVSFLLREYPVEYFKTAYRTSDLERAYPVPLDSMVAGWHRHLSTVAYGIEEQRAGERLFAMPSLLELDCPRKITREYRLMDRYGYYMAEADTASAIQALGELMALSPDNQNAWEFWSSLRLVDGGAWEIIPAQNSKNPLLVIRLADIAMMDGQIDEANELLRQFQSLVNDENSSRFRPMINRRRHLQDWSHLLSALYDTDNIDGAAFSAMNPKNRMYALQQMLHEERRDDITDFLPVLLEDDYDPGFFSLYLQSIEYAALNGKQGLALNIADFLSNQRLRSLQQVKLDKIRRFITFSPDG